MPGHRAPQIAWPGDIGQQWLKLLAAICAKETFLMKTPLNPLVRNIAPRCPLWTQVLPTNADWFPPYLLRQKHIRIMIRISSDGQVQ
jgi:hypothetical protein